MNTIVDMRNENDYENYYNVFEYNHDFLKYSWKLTM